MDEQVYRSTYHSINTRRCAFEKAILSRRCACSHCNRFHLADREGAACESTPARQRCRSLLEQLRQKALFALHITHLEGELPHTKEIKVQTGGLLGLQRAMEPNTADPQQVGDIAGLIAEALHRYGDVSALPYPEIMQSVVKFEGRHRRRRT